MKLTMVRSSVITASLLACSVTASDPTKCTGLVLPTLPVTDGSDFPPVTTEAVRVVPTRRDQLSPPEDCGSPLWSGFVTVGDDERFNFAFARAKGSETLEDKLPPFVLPGSRANDNFHCGKYDDLKLCLSKMDECGNIIIFKDKFAVPSWVFDLVGRLPGDFFGGQSVADDHPKREDDKHDGKKSEHDGKNSEHKKGNEGLPRTSIGSATAIGPLTILLIQAVPVFLAFW